MNIQLFSFSWGRLYRGFHNSEPLTDFIEPGFCWAMVQNFTNTVPSSSYWSVLQFLHQYSQVSLEVFSALNWVPLLLLASFFTTCLETVCIWISLVLERLKLFTWETIWAWWLENDAFSTSSLIISLFRILVSSEVNFSDFYIF